MSWKNGFPDDIPRISIYQPSRFFLLCFCKGMQKWFWDHLCPALHYPKCPVFDNPKCTVYLYQTYSLKLHLRKWFDLCFLVFRLMADVVQEHSLDTDFHFLTWTNPLIYIDIFSINRVHLDHGWDLLSWVEEFKALMLLVSVARLKLFPFRFFSFLRLSSFQFDLVL